MRTSVRCDDGKVWIEGVEGFHPGEFADSVHGCQARVLEAIGEPLTYADLICYSGFAFRVNVHEAMCPSGGHPCCGYMCLENGIRALPWRVRTFDSFPWEEPKEDRAGFEAEACKAIGESIDRGVPVHYGGEEDGLIIGYAQEGRRWWCLHPYHEGGRKPFWHDEVEGFAGGKWPWTLSVWQGPRPAERRVPERNLTVATLRQAVEMWKTEKRGDYFCGEAAYRHWLEWLRGVEEGQVEDPAAGMQGNGWYLDVLVHSRRIAAEWLARKAEGFEVEVGDHLATAADHYGRLVEVCMDGIECPSELAPPPGQAEQRTTEMRREEIRRLEAARGHDRAAVAALEVALAGEQGHGRLEERFRRLNDGSVVGRRKVTPA